MTDPLTRLAIIHGTDKIGYHDYTPKYFRLLRHLQDRPVRLLEIGVGGYQDADRGGESLEVWRDFFPGGTIVGIDIQKKEMDLGDRVTILQGSQVDPEFLTDLVRDHGPFDIIIDDGSHRNEHVVASFEFLFPTLAPGGIYVVEDVQTAFFPRFGGSLDLVHPNSVGYFAGLFASGALPADVRTMTRFHNMIALEKTGGDDRQADFVTAPDQDAMAILELGAAGDLEGMAARFADATVKRLGKGPSLRKADLKALKSEPAGAYDLVIDHVGSDEAFRAGFAALKTGGTWVAATPALDFFRTLFVDVDHREIRVNYPDAAISPEAPLVAAMHRAPVMVAVEKGANDYPSNFAFDYTHPEAVEVFAAMEAVLEEAGRERGILRFVDMMTRAGDEPRVAAMLERLNATEATTRQYFNVAVRQAKIDQDWGAARVLLDKAVALYPDDPRILSQMGTVHVKERDWDSAVAVFRRATSLAPRDGLIHVQLANALSQQGNPDEAVSAAALAVALAPERPGYRVQLGRLQVNAGRLEDAVRTLREALRLDPEVPNAHRQLSRALEALGETDEALDVARAATDLFPENAEYRRWQEKLEAA